MNICKFCQSIRKNDNSLRNHERLCRENPNRQYSYFVNNQDNLKEKRKLAGYSNASTKAKKEGREFIVSESTRNKLSKANKNRKFTDKGRKTLKLISEKVSATVKKKVADGTWHTSLAKKMHIDYNGIDLHGTWELEYAKYLDANNIKWERCKESFSYEFEQKNRKYTPDFYLVDTDEYVEIKGYKTNKDEAKWKQFPSYRKLKILMKEDLQKLGINI